MDWQSLLWAGGLVALIIVMMRGCGGMAAGGCGMGSRRRATGDDGTRQAGRGDQGRAA